MGKRTKLGLVCLFIEKKAYFCQYTCDIKMAGKKQNMAPVWKKLMKNVDLEEPTSCLDHVCIWNALSVNAD